MNLFCSVLDVQLAGKFCNSSLTVVVPSNFLFVPCGLVEPLDSPLGELGFGTTGLGGSGFVDCPGSGVM
jgi:hypothetical protein